MMTKNQIIDNHKLFIKATRLFLEFCQEELNLKSLPKIKWMVTNINNRSQPSFGGFNPNDGSINIEILNRHQMDIFRTIAHELCHYKQHINDELNQKSGETGSREENWANSIAGIIIRKFGKKYPNFYKCKPIINYL